MIGKFYWEFYVNTFYNKFWLTIVFIKHAINYDLTD